MISGGNATVYVSDMDAAIRFYAERLGLNLTNRFGRHWATVETGPSYWTTGEAGAGLTVGLHPRSSRHAVPGTAGGVGFGLETYEASERVAARLRDRGVRVAPEIVRFEAGNVFTIADQDGLGTYVHEFPPFMLEGVDAGEPAGDNPADPTISGGHAIVYVSDMDAAVRFYSGTLGLTLTNRFGGNFATVEAGRLVLAIHPKTPRTPEPGTKGSVALGFTIDEPIDRVVSRLGARGVRFAGSIAGTETDRFVEFEDPDGNSLYLWEPVRQEEPVARRAVGTHS